VSALADRLAERIHREGPIPFDAFVDGALYGEGGFFARARGAGRAGGDFVTSPEVGPLFGALVARAIDGWWETLGRPDPFAVVDAGAGRGRLARDVLAAAPACARALRLVLVERSDVLREAQRELLVLEPPEDALGPTTTSEDDDDRETRRPVTGMGPIVTALAALPASPLSGVVIANELLDNLPFRVVERSGRAWSEVRIGFDAGAFVEVLVPAAPDLAREANAVVAGRAPNGARLPIPTGARQWLHECAGVLARGYLAIIDYVGTSEELLARGPTGWLRTYRGHERGGSPLANAGEQDITVDLPFEYIVHAAGRAGFALERTCTQAEWLAELGVGALVDDARAGWDARAAVGDLEAIRHRSRVSEAAALLDPAGLGAHRVLVFRAGRRALGAG
jgi:SAM-dependent MidA family methyltransferase